ncbi:nucleoporin protein Ndc1-Nup [Parasitella parasitica]|nr:nucleoporin protein Ndc1-Nup [Parasitella parasitica]
MNGRYYKSLVLFSIAFAILFQSRFTISPWVALDLFSWNTFLFSLVVFSTGLVIFFIRNMTFTVFEPTYPSIFAEIIANWTSLDNLLFLIIHSVLNIFIIRFYFSWIASEKYTQDLLLQPPGHYSGARQLNQENIFITFYSVLLAFGYTIRYIANRSNVVKINNVQQPYFYDIKTSVATLFCKSATMAITYFMVAWTLFGVFRKTIYYWVARVVGLHYRVLDTPIVGFSWFGVHLFLRLIVAGTATMCTYNIANRIYDTVYSSIFFVSDQCTNKFDGLVEGLSETKINVKVAAFSELAALTTKNPEKRKELFCTVSKETQGNAWHKIIEQCFKVINELRTAIDIEYNGVQPVAVPAPVSKPAEPQQVRNRLEFSNQNIYATHTNRIAMMDDRTSTVFQDFADQIESAPSVVPDILTMTSKVLVNVQKSQMIEMLKRLELKVGHSGYFSSSYTDSVDRRVQTVFNKYQLVVWAVQSLGSLSAASLKEDTYGYVQNDLANVLNQLLGCLVDVENYLETPPAQYSNLLKSQNVVIQETEAVVLALREAIYQIRLSFNDFLSEFRIDGRCAKKWERFLANQE